MNTHAELSFLGADIEIDSNFEVDENFNKISIRESPERIKNSIVCIVLEGSALWRKVYFEVGNDFLKE